jgi:hypothetical protein
MATKCGAKTRAGGRCQQPGMPKNGRCRYHGGMSTGPGKGNQNATQHGIYAKYLTEDERVAYAELKLGSVEQELRLTRIRLARALAAEEAAQGEPELDEVVTHDLIGEEGSREDRKEKVRDYVGIIDKLTARIESLEKTRALLIELGGDPDKEPPTADGLTPGKPDEATPEAPIR